MFESDSADRALAARERRATALATAYDDKHWGHVRPVRRNELETERARNFKENYDLTLSDYAEMYHEQDGCCAICGVHKELDAKGAVDRLHVDHNHQTFKVRSLLCADCNKGIGCLRDSPDILREAAAYLEHHNELAAV